MPFDTEREPESIDFLSNFKFAASSDKALSAVECNSETVSPTAMDAADVTNEFQAMDFPSESKNFANHSTEKDGSTTLHSKVSRVEHYHVLEVGSTAVPEEARQKTLFLLREDIDHLISASLDEIHRSESIERENQILNEYLQVKNEELAIIRESESQLRATILNLKNAIQQSCAQDRQHAQYAKAEAAFQFKICELQGTNESTLLQSKAWQRQAEQCKMELQQSKTKFDALLQEKLHLERDHRETMAFAKSLENSHTASDVEYYKRKVSDLSQQVQELFAVVSEKNRQIDDLTHQIERSMTQNQIVTARGALKKRKRSM